MSHQNRSVRWLAVVIGTTIGFFVSAAALRRPRADKRGLSQSTENAILLAGAITIATGIVIAVGAYVKSKLP